MIEENVVAEAGTVHFLTLDQIRAAIAELGFTPRQRNVFYELIDPAQESFAISANRTRDEDLRGQRAVVGSEAAMSSKPHTNGNAAAKQLVPLSIVPGDGTA